MANDKESKGICIEINANRSYRIMKISPDKTEPLTKGRNGWVKNTFAITKDYNEIMVKTHQRVYDLYINQKYIQSFSDIELVKGKVGLFIGPHSRASFQFITWMGEQKIETDKEIDIDPNASPEEQTLTKVLIQMRNELKWKDKELEELKIQLKNCKASSSEVPSPKMTESALKTQEKEQLLQELKDENDILRTELAKSRADLKRLQRMKSQMENMDDGDYVIQLTELVAEQKSKIEHIENALIIADDNHRRVSQELNVMMDEINKRNTKINQLEQRNNTLDSLTNRYRDLLRKNNIDPNASTPSDSQPKRDDTPPPVKKNDQSTDTDDIIEEIIRRQREERRRREN
jgi:DNA repair exonuclease SbcCD ATPase subunit